MNYPGTTIPVGNRSGREFLDGIFTATQGLFIQQVCEISGLAKPAIQNWVARGFIPHPINRRYDKDALAGILLVNCLRGLLPLEDVKRLLTFMNGSPDTKLDDVIPESELYAFVCDVLLDENLTSDNAEQLICSATERYKEKNSGDKQRLRQALTVISEVMLAEKMLNKASSAIAALKMPKLSGETAETKTD